jgi:carboxyl-terminal processing protease
MSRGPAPSHASGSGQALFLLGLVSGLLAALTVDRATRYFLDRDLELVRAVRDMALAEYVREVEPAELIDDALNGMLQELDAHSAFYGPREIAALERETTGEFRGIGAVFRSGEAGRILFPYPGSPADRAGLRVGDRILRAGGMAVARMAPDELQSYLHGAQDELELEVENLEGDVRAVRLRPEPVLDPTVRHTRLLVSEEGLGYVAIRSFSHRTPHELDEALARLEAGGMRALVLDLRANPGGILDSAVAIANRFIAAGTLVATRTRNEVRRTTAVAEEARQHDLPLVVLLDGYTASASEVLAAALQDHAVAVLVGEPTYGKGTVQTLKRIGSDRAVVKLTTAHYCSPSLRRIEHDALPASSGIAPDLHVALTREERERVYEFLATYSPPEDARAALQEWEQRAGQALVATPPEDAQLRAAVALFEGEALDLHGSPRE